MSLLKNLRNRPNPTAINTSTLSTNMPMMNRIATKLGEAGQTLPDGRRLNPLTGDVNRLTLNPNSVGNGVPMKKVYGRRMVYQNLDDGARVGVRPINYLGMDEIPKY